MSTSSSPRTQCPHCRKVMKIKSESLFGRRTKCPQCSEKFEIQPVRKKSRTQKPATSTSEMTADETSNWLEDFSELEQPRQQRSSGQRSSRTASEEEDYGFGDTLPAPVPRRRRSSSDGEALPKKKKRPPEQRRRRQPTGPSPFVQFLAWAGGSFAGGLVGAVLWAVIAYFTWRESAFIAWAVGGLTGMGALVAANACGESQGFGSGLTAAFMSLVAIFLGKVMAFTVIFGGDVVLSSIVAVLSVGLFDGLFILLAFFSAYRVGAGLSGDEPGY
ncbi:hypothetical protein Pla110_45640 [Polystyrenella longa]|uniref:Uncharacterized protein n=1 Tax=Polystyrenella longa TaxID=2528007 RepID=A0A518CUA3_9PLAN|nr:hypothetical protein [Polystyrenella longa]QDU82801.1 hypothetical protein Pla110_45640 [Polystyrenella longa]